jgi:predicted nucleic acid-binding protein
VGSLVVPVTGSVYVDTQIVIYTIDKHPIFNPILYPFWQAVSAGAIQGITSEFTILETLVLPLRHNDQELINLFEQFLEQPILKVVPISRKILREAATLRAKTSKIRTADAIHAATALSNGYSLFLTNDSGLRALQGIQVSVLLDYQN